ncbi:Crp/Fnr family transcriptional regulator [Bradyrhizobium sp. INPA03-11B]|uniref:Crp/Fnr family transcriptional regulator n=1 Tax=Bradyrhizobium sp. INPA03-11B TaxID=418598 RepID=UPI00338F8C87
MDFHIPFRGTPSERYLLTADLPDRSGERLRIVDNPLRNGLLALLPRRDLRSLTAKSGVVEFTQGDVVQKEREEVTDIYFPLSGMLSLLVVLRDGRMAETSVVGREGLIGARAGLGSQASLVRVVAQLPVRALRISMEDFRAILASSSAMAEICLKNADVLLDQARITAACNSLHLVEERFCRWLLHTADRAESDQFDLKQELLSQMLGVRRTTITDTAKDIQKRGAITYSRGKLQILNRRLLLANSCECYELLKRAGS